LDGVIDAGGIDRVPTVPELQKMPMSIKAIRFSL
jgi:hypothetical protein